MTCDDVDRLLSEGHPARELKSMPAVVEHVRTCPRCDDVLAWTEAPVPDPGLGTFAEVRIRSILQTDLRPVRPLPSTLGAIGGALSLAAGISLMHALTMGAKGWVSLSAIQASLLGGFVVVMTVLITISLIASIRPGSRRRGAPSIPIVVLAIGFPALVGGLFPSGSRDHFFAEGVRCLAGGVMVAAMTAGITYAIARRGYSTNWPLTGAMIGAIGGVVAILALQISCPDQEAGHLMVWHGLAMLLVISGGYLGGRWTRPA